MSISPKKMLLDASVASIQRRGVTMTELLVAATLLVTGISLIVPVAVRTSQLWKDTRHHHLAVAEMQNQLERLTSMDPEQLDDALGELRVSGPTQDALANAKITCVRRSDSDGDRLVLTLVWDRRGGRKPLTLVAWLPEPFAPSQESPPLQEAGL